MTEVYIKLFEGLIERLTRLVYRKEISNELNDIIDNLLACMKEIWDHFKIRGFNISNEEKRKFEWKLEKQQLKLNDIVKKYNIRKKCSRCKRNLLSTTKNFYVDRTRKGGLSIICKACHKEKYRRKKENDSM